jgi:hypothetical protein
MEWIGLAEVIPAPVEWNLGIAVVVLGVVTALIPGVVAVQRIIANQLAAVERVPDEGACAPVAGRAA